MTHPDFSIKNSKGKDEAYSSVTISNSCSGDSPLQISLGAYRMVCSNGLVRYDEHADFEKIKHNEINFLNLDRFIHSINKKSQDVISQLNIWKQQNLTFEQINKLAFDAAKLLHDENDEKFNPNALLQVNRVEDEGNDIWTVFNRIQENLTADVKDKQLDIWLNKQLYELTNKELVYV